MPETGNKRLIVRNSVDGPILAVFDSHPSAETEEPAYFMRVRSINSDWQPAGTSKIVVDRVTIQSSSETPLIDLVEPWAAGGLVFELYQLRGHTAVRGRRVSGGRCVNLDEDAYKKPLSDEPTREEVTLHASGIPVRIPDEELSVGDRPEPQ